MNTVLQYLTTATLYVAFIDLQKKYFGLNRGLSAILFSFT